MATARLKNVRHHLRAAPPVTHGRRRFLALLAAATLAPVGVPVRAAAPVTLFAAASTVEAMTAAAATYAAGGHGTIRPVFAASSTLAQQIIRGAPADLYLSANKDWMDRLEARGVIEADTRIDLLGNRLVLIAPAQRSFALRIAPGFDLATALGDGRLAMGEPTHVPAGTYARAALQYLGVWDQLAPKLAYMSDVRAALALVERGEAAAGIVYATDAAASRKVRIVDTFPAQSHPPIAYPLAMIAGRRAPATQAVYDFLRGAEASAIFASHGFVPLASGA